MQLPISDEVRICLWTIGILNISTIGILSVIASLAIFVSDKNINMVGVVRKWIQIPNQNWRTKAWWDELTWAIFSFQLIYHLYNLFRPHISLFPRLLTTLWGLKNIYTKVLGISHMPLLGFVDSALDCHFTDYVGDLETGIRVTGDVNPRIKIHATCSQCNLYTFYFCSFLDCFCASQASGLANFSTSISSTQKFS